MRDYVRPRAGDRVLDLGCGPGELVDHLGDVRYVGVDESDGYFAPTRSAIGPSSVSATRRGSTTIYSDFDVVLAFGVIHHLDDQSALRLLSGAKAALAPGGRFVSIDPAMVSDDRAAARPLASWDRGDDVRGPAEHKRLAESAFDCVRCEVLRDLQRMPYTHCVLEGKRGVGGPPR